MKLKNPSYQNDGYELVQSLIPPRLIEAFYDEVRAIGVALGVEKSQVPSMSIDEIWQALAAKDRRIAGKLYDAVKHSLALRQISCENRVIEQVAKHFGTNAIGLVDLNVRIDPPNESKFLFDWHQDYWFSICSTQAMVVWIPLVELHAKTGGINIISNQHTGGKIYKVKRSPVYHSYSNSILLNEEIPEDTAQSLFPRLGDCVLFKFNCLHKSMQNVSTSSCRWTLQLRFAAYNDPEFAIEAFRPGVVKPDKITYMERIEQYEKN